jgi:formylglycine-generating enzyme required for sulfatase activity
MPERAALTFKLTVAALAANLALASVASAQHGTTDAARIQRRLWSGLCSYEVSPGQVSHGAGAETGTVTVTAPRRCKWVAVSSDPWLTITAGTSGTGEGTVTYAVTANITPARTGTLTIAGIPVTVAQAADEVTVSLGAGSTVPLVLVRIPAGTFTMGSPAWERERWPNEGPEHQVTVSSFYIGKTEVTQAQWAIVMGAGIPTCGSYGTGSDYPAYCVSWDDICGGTTGSSCTASSFIGRLNAQQGSARFRLPTEAEWEYAARAGTTTRFSHGDVLDCSDRDCTSCATHEQYMWWCGNNSPDGAKEVGGKQANPWGLFDMHGNVGEWVGDWYDWYSSAAQTDPPGPESGIARAVRGGNWAYEAYTCRSARRYYFDTGIRYGFLGFRLALSQ